jgi:hypothetical protein
MHGGIIAVAFVSEDKCDDDNDGNDSIDGIVEKMRLELGTMLVL